MNKKIFILFLIFVPVLVMAQEFKTEFQLDTSLYLNSCTNEIVAESEVFGITEYEPQVEVEFSGRLYYDIYNTDFTPFVGGKTSILTDITDDNLIGGFTPFFSWYLFETGIRFKNVEFYYEHLCAHTSTVYGYTYTLLTGVDKSYDKIGIRFNSK
jgi:hypothetical protein